MNVMGNASARAGGMLDEETLAPGVRKAESGRQTTNTTANDRGGSSYATACLPTVEDGHRASPPLPDLARLLLHSLRPFLLYGRCQSFVKDEIFFTNAINA